MESLKRAMRWDEERFGREYDLDVFNIVAVSDFNMGAMENKGLNIFNDKLVLARPDTASDADYASIEGVIAHEYFHNWSGDRVTCRDWFQLCLKEGLTVFRDQEFTGDTRSGPVERIAAVRMLKTHQFPEDAGPLAHPVRPASYIEINNFYTATVYEKGAEVCRMLQTLLGRDGFRKGLDLYFERHDGEAVTVEDFVEAMADVSGRDLSQFMLWYTQSGTPELACSLDYDPHAKTARLAVSQVVPPTPGQTKKEPMLIPLKMGLIGANGDELPLKLDGDGAASDGLLEITDREQVFEFRDVPVAADALSAARLLRAGPPHHQPRSRPDRVPDDARPGCLQSLAGGADLRHQSADRRRARRRRRPVARHRQGGDRGSPRRSAPPPATLRSPQPIAPSSSSCRASRTSPASLPAMSIPTPCATRARRCGRTIAGLDRRRPRRALRGDRAHGPLFARPARARACGRCAAPPSISSSRPVSRRTIARAERHYREASNMTDAISRARHPLSSRRACARRGARAFLRALAGRAARARQMVRGAGARRAPRFGRDRARAPLPSRNSR